MQALLFLLLILEIHMYLSMLNGLRAVTANCVER
jgi:hypothetical protein